MKYVLYCVVRATAIGDFHIYIILRVLTRHCWGPCLLGDIAFATGFDRLDIFNLVISGLTSSELPTAKKKFSTVKKKKTKPNQTLYQRNLQFDEQFNNRTLFKETKYFCVPRT